MIKFNNVTIKYLFHLTHISNLKNIREHGLLSRNKVIRNSLNYYNIADPEVLSRGENIGLFDYVRFYFNPRNPMLYRRKNIQGDVLILCINTDVLNEVGSIISDGNASSSITQFYNYELSCLNYLDWNAVLSQYWNDFEDGKRKSCAEILIPNSIPFSSVEKIVCQNSITGSNIKKELGFEKLMSLSEIVKFGNFVVVDDSLFF